MTFWQDDAQWSGWWLAGEDKNRGVPFAAGRGCKQGERFLLETRADEFSEGILFSLERIP